MKFEAWIQERNTADDERMALVAAAVLNRDSNVVDVGAASGAFLATAMRLAPAGRHIAYEPLANFCDELRTRFASVDVRTCAVADFDGASSFLHVLNAPGWSGLRDYPIQIVGGPEIEIIRTRVVTLDGDLPDDYAPDLLKVDVNGAEGLLFAGALRTLSRHKPTVLFEHGQAAVYYGTSSETVFRLLDQSGLRIFTLEGRGPLPCAEFSRSANEMWNFLARP